MNIKNFPPLYKKTYHGKTEKWEIKVRMSEKQVPLVCIIHGQVDGKKVEEERTVVEGKNIGRANETTPWEQAVSEAKSTWNQKKDEGYRESLEDSEIPIRPMLAQEFKKYKHKIAMPCHVQPKLNGVRCVSSLSDGVTHMMSRNGKPILKFAHIREEIKTVLQKAKFKDFYLDGEIYKHGMSLQNISGTARKEKDDLRKEDSMMEYHVYDCFQSQKRNWSFEERNAFLEKLIRQCKTRHIMYVETLQVKNEKEAMKYYEKCLRQNFEGIMFRNSGAPYHIGFRSTDLQKFKPFKDDEFVILGAHEGSGNDAGTVVWECLTKDKRKFSVKPEGERETRKRYWKQWKKFVGKKLTVRYQELSDEGVPIFPVGVAIRDYE